MALRLISFVFHCYLSLSKFGRSITLFPSLNHLEPVINLQNHSLSSSLSKQSLNISLTSLLFNFGLHCLRDHGTVNISAVDYHNTKRIRNLQET